MILMVECEVGADIFESGPIKNLLDTRFYMFERVIKSRYNEIKLFLKRNHLVISNQLDYNHIYEHFRGYLYKEALNDAITYVLKSGTTYNIVQALIENLTEEKFYQYIMGKPMINAFERAISILPEGSTLDGTLNRAKVKLLKSKYLKSECV